MRLRPDSLWHARPTVRAEFAAAIALTAWFALGLQLYLVIDKATADGTSAWRVLGNFFGFFHHPYQPVGSHGAHLAGIGTQLELARVTCYTIWRGNLHRCRRRYLFTAASEPVEPRELSKLVNPDSLPRLSPGVRIRCVYGTPG